jgi:pyridoxal phosphate enzyme (YggS family)
VSPLDDRRQRRDDIARRLQAVRGRIADAARAAGRDPADVTLVVVTKTFPVSDIELLAELGVRDIGENRHPEAAEKAAALAGRDLVWHFIGQVQSNKATHIAAYADVVHSVDSVKVARRLDKGAVESGRELLCLVQVDLDPPERHAGRGGAAFDEIEAVAESVEAARSLRLGGLMAVAPPDEPAAEAFARLAEWAQTLRRDHPSATMLSAGMSGDFREAIAAGATHVRVGSAVLGSRPPLG